MRRHDASPCVVRHIQEAIVRCLVRYQDQVAAVGQEVRPISFDASSCIETHILLGRKEVPLYCCGTLADRAFYEGLDSVVLVDGEACTMYESLGNNEYIVVVCREALIEC